MTNAPTLSGLLHREHLHTLEVINDMEMRAVGSRTRPIDTSDADERFRLQAFIAMVDDDLFRHYRFEEDVLFPRLAEGGLAPITEILTAEHDAVRAIAERLRASAVAALAGGFTADAWRAFRDDVMDLVHSVSFHIQKEEMGVIRQLEMVLGSEGERELAARYGAFP